LAVTIASFSVAQAQFVKIHGIVQDSLTGEALPFVNVVFKGKNIGCTTDMNGKYTLQSEWGSSTIQFSSLGYFLKEVEITDKTSQKIDVLLSPKSLELKEVEISVKKRRYKNKDNPAVTLIKNVLAHRDENRSKSFEYFEFEKYEKVQYDVNNFSKDWLDSPSMRGFQVLRDYIDTSSLNGKPFIPVLIQEKVATVYQKDYGKDNMEVVKDIKLSGINNGDITSGLDQFMSKMGADVDIYESTIVLFDKSFTSPISPIGPNFYRYYITDSLEVDGHIIKKLAFMPRNKAMIAFTGFMWIGDASANYAVQSIELNLNDRANINFLDDMRITQEFEYSKTIGWHLVKNIMIVDFQPIGKAIGIYNTKTVSYKNFKVNVVQDENIYSNLTETTYLKSDNEDEDWSEMRHDSLSEKEKGIYDLVDTVKNIRQFKVLNNAIFLLSEGFVPAGKIEIGPVGSLVSYNAVEGIRVRAGFRTSKKFSKTWRFTAWGAYGLTDKRFKHGEMIEYYFHKNPNRFLSVSYTDNLVQPGFVVQAVDPDNLFLSLRRTPAINTFYERSFKIRYEHEWVSGFSNSITLNAQRIEANRYNTFEHAVTEEVVDGIRDNSVTLGTRFSFNEKYIQGVFNRVAVKTAAPIFNLNYTFSDPFLGSDYGYHKLNFSIEKRFRLGLFGYTDAVLSATKIWGVVPYPLLIIHRGNETITYSQNSFNLMNFMEFASDQSVALLAEHHFNGLVFGLIPGVNHFKMRLVVSAKILYGSVDSKNRDFSNPEFILPPPVMGELSRKPYAEGSIGIENIFNIMRIDLVKRFTYLDNPKIGNFLGVKGLAPRIAFRFKF
tara:strand:- start:20994 stop:23483 length:2490 start_codon:yes stop_codon:yes gene_type:complete